MVSQGNQTQPFWLAIIRLLRWDKPAGRLILMIPALWAVVLAARGKPPLPLVGVIILGTLATSAAGCVINDLWDRNIDPAVERTRNRPLASRTLSIQVGIVVAIVAFFCAWVLSTYLNLLTFWLCVAAVPVIILYPAAKRVFPVPQLVLAIAWGFAVLISWSAVSCGLSPAPTACLGVPTWWLWSATVFWTLGFDTIYALSDREDDRRLGVNSSALFFGDFAPHAVGLFFLVTALCLVGLGREMQLAWPYWLTLGLAAILWANQYTRLRQPIILPATYPRLFRQNVWLGLILLAGMLGGTWL